MPISIAVAPWLARNKMAGLWSHKRPLASRMTPALINKCVDPVDSGAREVTVWGTASATRACLYVEDAAQAIVLAAERYDGIEPINVGSGQELSLKELVGLVVTLASCRPDGQPRCLVDTSCAATGFGFVAKMPFQEGLRRTVEWYRQSLVAARSRFAAVG